MPNWCQNEVTVQADDRGKAEAFVNFVRDGDNYFSLNKIIPMPEELKNTNSPTRIVTEEELAEHIKEQEANPSPFVNNPITQETNDRWLEQYGATNWYDWAYNNWDTKWDTDCEEVSIDDFGGVEYNFDTAWSPPEPICDALRELFPKLEIIWFYKEEGNQIAGWL